MSRLLSLLTLVAAAHAQTWGGTFNVLAPANASLGTPVGTVTVMPLAPKGLTYTFSLSGLVSNGIYSAHVHTLNATNPIKPGVPLVLGNLATHLDPYNTTHGCPNVPGPRHVGDLGNLKADSTGKISMAVPTDLGSLVTGSVESVQNLVVTLHANPTLTGDDCKTVASSGQRIAAAQILLSPAPAPPSPGTYPSTPTAPAPTAPYPAQCPPKKTRRSRLKMFK